MDNPGGNTVTETAKPPEGNMPLFGTEHPNTRKADVGDPMPLVRDYCITCGRTMAVERVKDHTDAGDFRHWNVCPYCHTPAPPSTATPLRCTRRMTRL